MALRDKLPGEAKKIPKLPEERIARGRERMKEGKPARDECLKFWRGEHYVYRTKDNILTSQSTTQNIDGSGKPRHRVRTVRNLILDIVAQEVSAATQRVPGYEVNPSTSESEDVTASQIAGKVCRYGYDKWNVRKVTGKVATYAVVCDEGFAWPVWDSSVGPFIEDEDGKKIGEGEIKIHVFGGNEVFWEPGLSFDLSPWHGIQQARTVDSVKAMEGFISQEIKPDAEGDNKLCLVTEYLERPTLKNPNGQWLTLCGGKLVVPPRPYPCQDANGRVLDEPVLHKLSYFSDPEADRDMGLVRHLLDAQRTYNDCVNKMLEWKNLALNPQPVILNGDLVNPLTDEPGAVVHVRGSNLPGWRPVPAVPGELSRIKDEAKADMARISAQNDIPSQVESGRGIAALIEKDQSRRSDFISNLAEFHSRLMRHCLYLVQRHYTEPRLLKIRGRFGPTTISSFLGAQLRGQADVTVLPGSVEPRSRVSIEQRILGFADRGWISPQAAMAAINGGSAEALVESYELDVARANQIVQRIMDGPDALFGQAPRPALPDEQFPDETGEMILEVPGWMPRPFDNVLIHKAVIEDFLKTPDYDLLEDDAKQAAHIYYQALLSLEAQQQAQAEAEQMAQAQSLGMGNAASPQVAPPLPDQRAIDSPQLP